MRKGKQIVAWLLSMVLVCCSCLTTGTIEVFAETADAASTVSMGKASVRVEGKQGLRFVISLTQLSKAKDYGIEIRHENKTAVISKEQGFSKLSKWDKEADTAEYAAVVTDISKEYFNEPFEATGFVTYEKNGKDTTVKTEPTSVTMQQAAEQYGCRYDEETEKWVQEKPMISENNAKEPALSFYQIKTETQSETPKWNGLPIAKMDEGVTAEVQSDGSLLLQFTDVYQKIYFQMPENTTAEDYFSASVDVNIEEQFGFAVTDQEGAVIKEDYPGYDVTYNSDHQYTLAFDAPGSMADGRTMADGRMIQLQTLKNASYGNPGKHANIILKDLKLIPRKAQEQTGPTLLETYGSIFGHVGNAGDLANLQNPNDVAYYKTEYNSFTLGNQMKPDYILRKNGEKTLVSTKDAEKTYGYTIPEGYTEDTVPQLYFDVMDETLKLAQENGIQMRGHTFIWHQQTPSWFFKEGYEDSGAFVSPEVMNERVKFYVTNVMEHVCNGAYKDVIYAWDVANECLHQGTDPNKSGWVGVYGDAIVKDGKVKTELEYVKTAFQTADAVLRKAGLRDSVHLFYNDYNTYGIINECIDLINYLNEKDALNADGVKLCDGIGMQSHLDVMWPSVDQYLKAMDAFHKAGFEIQITELDVTLNMLGNQNTEAERLVYWKNLMEGILKQKANGANITAFVIWGMYDAGSWRAQYTPLLWGDSYYDQKEAYQIVIDAAKTYTGEVTQPSSPSTPTEPQKPSEPSRQEEPSKQPTAPSTPDEPIAQDAFHGFTVAKTDDGVTTKTNADGSITVSFTDKYQGVYLAFPKGKTAADYDSVTVDVSTAEQFALGLMDADFNQLKQDYPGYSVSGETRAIYTLGLDALENGANASDGCYLRLMTLDDVKDGKAKHTPITIYGVDTYKSGSSEISGATLRETYEDIFGHVGNTASLANLQNEKTLEYYKKEYNSFTSENEMKPENILRKNGSKTLITVEEAKKLGYEIPEGYQEKTVPQLYFDVMDATMKIAKENGIQMRGHTMIWHQQTPSWFFKEGYEDSGNYVTPEVMNERIRYYVTNLMQHAYSGAYKDVIYAWDVANEYFHQSDAGLTNSGWYQVYKTEIDPKNVHTGDAVSTTPSYVKVAFMAADAVLRETKMREKVSLIYNDYNTNQVKDQIISLIHYLNEKDTLNTEGNRICDGVGMQSHLDVQWPSVSDYTKAMQDFAKEGFEIQITELDVTINRMNGGSNTEAEHVAYWKSLMQGILAQKKAGANITALVFWGMYDDASWRGSYGPLLWGRGYDDQKESYHAVIQAGEAYKKENGTSTPSVETPSEGSQPGTVSEPSAVSEPTTPIEPVLGENEISRSYFDSPTEGDTSSSTAPEQPSKPSNGTNPEQPTAPASKPTDSVTSGTSSAPTGVSTPTAASGSEKPSTPGGSEKPTTPSSPEKPSTPGGSEKPTTPSSPEKPSTPGGSERPSTPGGSEKPTTPSVPSDAASVSVPEHPATPSGTSQPSAPSRPSEPSTSSTPTTPGTSEQPSVPSTPNNSSVPTKPTVPSVADVEVEEVLVVPQSLNMTLNSTGKLQVELTPANAADTSVTWKSDDSSVVDVDASGNVVALKKGNATVYAIASNGKKGSCSITVTDKAEVELRELTLSQSTASLMEKATLQLKATITPSNATNVFLTWESKNPTVATVSQGGLVTAVREGSADIVVSTVDGRFSAKCSVTVTAKPQNIEEPTAPSTDKPTVPSTVNPTEPSSEPSKSEEKPVKNIKVTKSSLTLVVGDKKSLGAKVEPSDATNKALTYDSLKDSIAIVSSAGKVTAKKPGKTTIKIKAAGGVTKNVSITVKPAKVSSFKAKPSKTSIKLTWKKMKDITGYQVYKYDSKKKTYKLYKTVKGTSLTVKNLKKNTTYKFKIRAYKSYDGQKLYGDYTQKGYKTKK